MAAAPRISTFVGRKVVVEGSVAGSGEEVCVRLHHGFGVAVFGLSLLASAGAASAEEGGKAGEKMPLPFAQRPLTLPRMTLAPEAEVGVTHFSLGSFGSITGFGLELGAHFGILDDLEVGAVVLPIDFAPDFRYGNPRVEGTFRFLKGTVEMGARLRATIATESGASGVILEPGLPMLFHITEAARLDTGVFVPMAFGAGVGPFSAGGHTVVGVNIPVQFIYDVIPELHIGARTGLGMVDFGHAGESFYIPLGLVAGYAIGNEKGPLVDIDPFFTFPYFAIPGSSGDKVVTALWQTGVTATVYLYL
jgi:hypothetical protein